MGHEMVDCTGAAKPIEGSDYAGEEPSFGEETKYIFVRLSVLREYLKRDLEMPNLPFPYDFERAVDDWVFMCFFVGNGSLFNYKISCHVSTPSFLNFSQTFYRTCRASRSARGPSTGSCGCTRTRCTRRAGS